MKQFLIDCLPVWSVGFIAGLAVGVGLSFYCLLSL